MYMYIESLKAIAENIHVTMEINGFEIPYLVGNLEKLGCKPLKVGHIEVPVLGWHGFPRNASEGQLSAFKQAGNCIGVIHSPFTLILNI